MDILKKIKTFRLDENLVSTLLGGSLFAFVVATNLVDASNIDAVKASFDALMLAAADLYNTCADIKFGELSVTGAVSYLLFRHKSEK